MSKGANSHFSGEDVWVVNEDIGGWVFNLTVLGNAKQNNGGLSYTLIRTANMRTTNMCAPEGACKNIHSSIVKMTIIWNCFRS